jgi:peptide chain release factor 1
MEDLNLNDLKKEYEEILSQLSDPELISNTKKLEELSKRKSYLEKLISKIEELKEIQKKINENEVILKGEEDQELIILAEQENVQLKEREKLLKKELEALLKNDNETSFQSVIVEIRAGVGGEEATLFAADLYRMYSKYAQKQGWQQKILESHPSELGGFKEIIFELRGNVFSKMQYEGGVHRVQRIPKTEKSGRLHTSTVSVAVLPKPKKNEIKINPQDLKIDFFRASGPGGQYVNKRETAVRITHLPTGLIVTSQTERNQLQNKENALAVLEAKLLDREKIIQETKMAQKRKSQIGQAKRAEKIRTYNFIQDRVTDHRIKKSWRNLKEIFDGELDQIVETLQKEFSN